MQSCCDVHKRVLGRKTDTQDSFLPIILTRLCVNAFILTAILLAGKSTLSGVMCHSVIRVHSEYAAQTYSVI